MSLRSIEVLSKETIDKIAAGEVVERPASVVKELTENAIDAGSTAITIEIRDGGTTFIRITDNGEGIPTDQVRLAFLRHATSKLRAVEDLSLIATLGFRGEALSSIAAVSQLEMITKTPDALTGTRYVIEGGSEKELEEIGAPSGTTILVRNLFYNTPARAKFLRTPASEANHVAQIVEELALSHPEISFKYLQNGQSKLFTSGNGQMKEIVYQIFGRDMARELVSVDYETELVHITGLIGKPTIARANRNFENYFVNGRYVKSKLMAKAIEDGYHGFLMQHKFPFTLLYLEIDSTQVDVNVHPTKMELRFSHQDDLYHAVCLAIQNSLIRKERIPDVSLTSNVPSDKVSDVVSKKKSFDLNKQTGIRSDSEQPSHPLPAPEPFEYNRRAIHLPASVAEPSGLYKPDQRPTDRVSVEKKQVNSEQINLFNTPILSPAARDSIRMIGQVFDTYWLMEYKNALYMVDQHAAHEKVLYERLMKRYRKQEILSQMVAPPAVLNLSSKDASIMETHLKTFSEIGYEIEPFGGNSFQIRAVPLELFGQSPEQLVHETLDTLSEPGDNSPEAILDKIASMACKAAVKGNQTLSFKEAEKLMDELITLENPYNCPHGRPTMIRMSRAEIDRKFKRLI